MCPDATRFRSMRGDMLTRTVKVGNGNNAAVRGIGEVEIRSHNACGGGKLRLSDVLYVPELNGNLISVGRLTSKGVTVTFEQSTARASLNGRQIFSAERRGNVYVLCTVPEEDQNEPFQGLCFNATMTEPIEMATGDGDLWHRRLGHVNEKYLRKIPLLSNVELESKPCTICIEGKFLRKGFHGTDERRAERILELTHSDVMGKFEPPSLGGARYVLTLLDDHSRYATVKFLKHKGEVQSRICQYRKINENKFGLTMSRLKTDCGGEYIGKAFENDLKNFGIEHLKSCPRCPEINGRSERLNRSLQEATTCMLIQSGAPKMLWAEAMNTACYVRNRCPSKAINFKAPIELWERREMTIKDLTELKVFGCRVWTHIYDSGKLSARAEECVFLGHEEGTRGGLRVYSLRSRRIVIRTNGIFEENVFPFKSRRKDFGLLPLTRSEPLLMITPQPAVVPTTACS